MVLNIITWNCAGGIKGKIDTVRQIAWDTHPVLGNFYPELIHSLNNLPTFS